MFKNRVVFWHILVSLFITQSIFWLIFLNFNQLSPVIPLWFQQPLGEAQLASKEMIWILPGLAAGFLAIDLATVAFLHRRQPFLVNIVMTISTMGSVYLLLATLNILNRVLGWI